MVSSGSLKTQLRSYSMKAKLPYMIAGALIFTILGVIYNLLMVALGWSGLLVVVAIGAFIGARFSGKDKTEEFEKATEGFFWDDQNVQ